MHKIYPIKVEKVEPQKYYIVEWVIGNVCNYNCSFCKPDLKSGDKRFLPLEEYTTTISKIIDESEGKKIWFKLTGGEPTLYPKLIDLLSYIKQTGNFTYIISNGSRTLRYWEELKQKNCIDFIALSFHPEQTDNYEHIIDIVNLFKDTSVLVTVNVTCPISFFDKAIHAFNEIKNRCPAVINLQQINDELGLKKYSNEQMEILKNHSMHISDLFKFKPKSQIPKELKYHSGNLIYTYNDGSKKTDMAINFIKRGETYFSGWQCDVGKDFIRILHKTVQRGVCGVGEKWSITDEKLFKKTPVICTKTLCDCTLDVIIPKEKI